MMKEDATFHPLLRRIEVVLIATLVLGAIVTGFWVARYDFSQLSRMLLSVSPTAVALVLLLSVVNLAIRWMRWHFLLRRAQVRIATRYSVEVFLYGLAMILTPAYVGECIKAWPIKTRYHYRARQVVAVVASERTLDVLALLTVWALGSQNPFFIAVCFGIVVLFSAGFAGALARASSSLDRARQLAVLRTAAAPATDVLKNLLSGKKFLLGYLLSLFAWSGVAASLAVLAWGFSQSCGLFDGACMFARSTLLGAVTLVPGGVGVSGSILVVSLKNYGFEPEAARVTVILLRLLTLWFAVGLGAATILYRAWKWKTGLKGVVSGDHFDNIADVYDADIASHVRDRLVEKKTLMMVEHLGRHVSAGGSGLDVGCGRGWYLQRLSQQGYRLAGIDLSFEQVKATRNLLCASHADAPVAVADVLHIPFREGRFDFAYAINIFHHLRSVEDQERAFRQVASVLRPGGIFFLHEINIANPLFRFYMNYVFPLIHNIDEGTERWILPNAAARQGFELVKVEYITFTPDFLPAFLARPAYALEKRLERSFMRPWSAHYLAVLKKV